MLFKFWKKQDPYPLERINCSLKGMFNLLVHQVIYHVCNMVYNIMDHRWKLGVSNKDKEVNQYKCKDIRDWLRDSAKSMSTRLILNAKDFTIFN